MASTGSLTLHGQDQSIRFQTTPLMPTELREIGKIDADRRRRVGRPFSGGLTRAGQQVAARRS
jgi:hypothetical protein